MAGCVRQDPARSVDRFAFHKFPALKEGVEADGVQAIRERRAPKDAQLAALSILAKTLIQKRGRLDDQDKESFAAAGFGPDHLLEVVAASTITNDTGSITNPRSNRSSSRTPGAPRSRDASMLG
jgi:hypothetical protein